MPPYSSSNFRPSLDPIAESCSLHLDKGKDANRRIAPQPDEAPDYPRDCRSRNNNNNTTNKTKSYPTSADLHRLMMADVPSPEVADQQHPTTGAAGAASLSSSQTQKTTEAKHAPAAETAAADLDADPQQQQQQPADDHQPSDTHPATPKLDPAGFFTLVSNASTNTTHHPTVRYIFADDAPDVPTSALAAPHDANQASSSSSSAAAAAAQNNRAILLDAVPGEDGRWTVASAASLSADFAVTQASIERQEGEKGGGGMVLRIDGVEGDGSGGAGAGDKAESLPSSNSAVAKSGGEEYGPLLEDFERKMTVLRKVVKAGEGRAEKARETRGAAEEGKGEEQE
ncbi:hypothetical protein CKAH01_06515 [Colletotrichum kahawae]|uniref:Uncharacterized protein n=1 Tax=Colletotrichum kahawae TaxID=34407 RepID=A0AAD9Y9H9_COLKA|nr:hypothetical protein CKAH01_06515 [Colletotrichum kahawae]